MSLAASYFRRPESPQRSPARWGGFVVVTLAVFAGGLYFWPGPVRGYLVCVTLGISGSEVDSPRSGSALLLAPTWTHKG